MPCGGLLLICSMADHSSQTHTHTHTCKTNTRELRRHCHSAPLHLMFIHACRYSIGREHNTQGSAAHKAATAQLTLAAISSLLSHLICTHGFMYP